MQRREFHHAGETRGEAEPSSGSCRAPAPVGAGRGRWGPQEPRGGHRASGHLRGGCQGAGQQADPVMGGEKCGALGSCGASSHPADREAEGAGQCRPPEMLDSCNSCLHMRILLSTYSSTTRTVFLLARYSGSMTANRALSFAGSARAHRLASLAEHEQAAGGAGFSGCSARTELPSAGMRDLEPGSNLLSSALAGGFTKSLDHQNCDYHIRYWSFLRPGCWRDRLLGATIYPCIKHSLERLCFAGLNPQRSKKAKDFIFSGLCKSCCCGQFVSSGSFSFAWSRSQFPHLVSPRVTRHRSRNLPDDTGGTSLRQPSACRPPWPLAVLLRTVRRLLTEAPAGPLLCAEPAGGMDAHGLIKGPGRAFGGQSAYSPGSGD